MSVTQNFDSYSAGNTAAAAGGGGGAPNADFDLKDAQLDEASAGGAEGQSGILSGGIGQVAQNATQMVSWPFYCYIFYTFLAKRLFSWKSSFLHSQFHISCFLWIVCLLFLTLISLRPPPLRF